MACESAGRCAGSASIAQTPDLLSVGDGTLVAPGVDFFTHNREAVNYVFEVSTALAKMDMG